MFKDYYAILEIVETASLEEIKFAFNKQALKWHPDRNLGVDTTKRMQEINEAYLILKDAEARQRYNIEYQRFKHFRQETKYHQTKSEAKESQQQDSYEFTDYDVNDNVLKKWMGNARKQAVDLAKQTIEDFKGMVAVGAKAAVKEAGNLFTFYIIIGLISILVLGISKSCNH